MPASADTEVSWHVIHSFGIFNWFLKLQVQGVTVTFTAPVYRGFL